jgi:hypothetical protein
MVTFFITAVFIIIVLGIGLYFWQKPSSADSVYVLPPKPDLRGLFEPERSAAFENEEQSALEVRRRKELIERARNGEPSSLLEAHASRDSAFYDRVLSALVDHAGSAPNLLSLMSYVTQHDLRVNNNLANAVIASWQTSPDRQGTAKALHFAALSDEPETYRRAVETALHLWRESKLADISPIELRALFDGEFWVLSSRSRSSGAGFVLKRTLESARRELEAATGAKQ